MTYQKLIYHLGIFILLLSACSNQADREDKDTLNIVPTWTRGFHVSCKGKVQICLRPGMFTGKNLVCKRMLKKKRMPENRKEISFFV